MKKGKNKLNLRNYEMRYFTNADNDGIIEGVPIVFNEPTVIHDWCGDYVEIIDRRALDDADLKDVCLFVNHNTEKIALARSKNGNENSTMSFEIKDDGLHIRAKLDIENNSESRNLYSAIKRGDIDGMSFAFRVGDEEWTNLSDDMPQRTIKAISIVHEVSAVNHPAYSQTTINARNSAETEYSPLAEARKKHTEETVNRNRELLEIEKLKMQTKFYFKKEI